MNSVRIEVRDSVHNTDRELRDDVRKGLTARQKWLPSKWLYDARGSKLFERITELPEYYPTRAEHEILRHRSVEIATTTHAGSLIELGSGSSEKTRQLLDALTAGGTLGCFVPVDVSESALSEAANAIARDYPELVVHGLVGDVMQNLGSLPGQPPRLVVFLGGTLGNLVPAQRAAFLRSIRATLTAGEWLLLGTDLVKDTETLLRAYDDADGVTAEFNRNVLRVLNERLGADFDPEAFEHVCHWDGRNEWIEMHLRARTAMQVRIPEVGVEVGFAAGESVRTEVSAKFRRNNLREELVEAGFRLHRWWHDTQNRFALSLFSAV